MEKLVRSTAIERVRFCTQPFVRPEQLHANRRQFAEILGYRPCTAPGATEWR